MTEETKEVAELKLGGETYTYPVITGTEGEKGIDISTLRKDTGHITLDVGFVNTGSCTSKITYIDGENGILRYRGIPIEVLAQKSTFVETAYLLLHDRLPSRDQLDRFSELLNEFSMIHEDMRHFFQYFPHDAHPMNILGVMVNALSSFYPNVDALSMAEQIDVTATRLISKIRTLATFAYKKSIGEPVVYPRRDMSYCANFLTMMFDSPVTRWELDPDHKKALSMLLILHADHEQNCSTTAVRLVGSARTNLYASVAAGVSALWGPLHGGANQAVVEMLGKIHRSGEKVDKFIEMAKDKSNSFRLMGFGHRVYKNYDPRAKVIKELAGKILTKASGSDPLFELALELESKVLEDDYFIERRLYPNVDFYSGLLYKAMGFPVEMFPVLFAIGRMPGWISQWKEMIYSPGARIFRPRQIYMGRNERDYTPIGDRGRRRR